MRFDFERPESDATRAAPPRPSWLAYMLALLERRCEREGPTQLVKVGDLDGDVFAEVPVWLDFP